MNIQDLNTPEALKQFLSAYHKRLHNEISFPPLSLQKSLDHAAQALAGVNWHTLLASYSATPAEPQQPTPFTVLRYFEKKNDINTSTFSSEDEVNREVSEVLRAEIFSQISSADDYEQLITAIKHSRLHLDVHNVPPHAQHDSTGVDLNPLFNVISKLEVEEKTDLYNAITTKGDWLSFYDEREDMPKIKHMPCKTIMETAESLGDGVWRVFRTNKGRNFAAKGRSAYLRFLLMRMLEGDETVTAMNTVTVRYGIVTIK